MTITFPLPKRISKSTLSQYLRTKCDRQLFFSLHQPATLQAAGLPEPMPARPGVGMLQSEGRTFEEQRNKKLISAFGSRVIYAKGSSGQPTQEALSTLLAAATASPAFLLQAKIEPKKFQSRIMANLGLHAPQQSLIPPMDGLIPDILIVRNPKNEDQAVTAQGGRRVLTAADQNRRAIVVIDVKHTSEANPSYSAEVAFYAVMIANWLEETGLENEYYVALNCALWTRFKEGDSSFDFESSRAPAPSAMELMDALMDDCEDANLRFYLPTVLRFFREDLPRVISAGDAKLDGWRQLEWHVDSRCSSCDFLGYARWVPDDFKKKIQAQPDHYCHPGAEVLEHLSRIAGMTRGGRKTLHTAAIGTTSAIAATTGTEPVYTKHTFLKREGAKLPARAKALASNKLDLDTTALLATLAPWPHLTMAVAVNFDPSSGLLTGLAVGGSATTYTKGQKPIFLKHQGFVVDQKSLDAEWNELKAFLSAISDSIEQAATLVSAAGKGPLKGQVAFWEARQFEELCNAVGRHLPKVLALKDRKQRALAWMFPPQELLEKDAGAIPPCVVFLDEIVRRVVFAPVAHVITLFDTTEHYHAGTFNPAERDAFYREFLTNGIPRERIYELWSNEPQIVRGKQTKSRNQVITEFSLSLAKQSASIASVAERLRQDFKGSIRATNPAIDLSNPTGAQGVAFDAKLWIWWDKLGFATNKAAAHQRLALDAQTLEANYEALRLKNGTRIGSTDVWEFDVLATSTESKIEQGDSFLAIGKEAAPGFPLTRAIDHLPTGSAPYSGADEQELLKPLHSAVRGTVIGLDRTARRAAVRIQARSPQLLDYLLQQKILNTSAGLFLTAGKPLFDWSATSTDIFRAVGNPAIATPDPNASAAMGIASPAKAGTSAVTPLAKLLWSAPTLQAAVVMPNSDAIKLAQTAASRHALNPSQVAAVTHALERSLSVIWGPPGTGKTKTLAAYVQTLVAYANTAPKRGLKVLLTGPTYKAVEELVGRLIQMIDGDSSCRCDVFVCYPPGRPKMLIAKTGNHLQASSVEILSQQLDANCIASVADSSKVSIVATSVLQAHKFGRWINGALASPVFDVVVIDESSQVDVTKAIGPISVLKDGGRTVIAGDHLQMPPIAALEAPVGAEYLVGSIQSYLLKRPFGVPVLTCDLTQNYRSHEDIVAFARSIGYPQQLSAHFPDIVVHPLGTLPGVGAGYPPTLPHFPELALVVASKPSVMTLLHDDDLSSQGNEIEASIVASIAWSLRATLSGELDGQAAKVSHALPDAQRFWQKCVGIVTPHRAQRALVVRELSKLFPKEVNLIEEAVDTVEKFQGGERHVILVSFGVADTDVISGEEAFLMQLERTNVAISRAQAKCIVVMPTTLAGHVPQDKKALLTAHAIKDYVDDFCNQEIPISITLAGGAVRKGRLRYRA